MLPTAYEFHWDLGHLIFLGVFYGVITVVACTLALAFHNWRRDLRRRRAEQIGWHETMHDLPAERRHCRHEFTGSVAVRVCAREFDCAHCPDHASFAAEEAASCQAPAATGLDLPANRLYHRGHTWVEPQADGTCKIGVDDLLQRCIGRPEHVVVPAVGCQLQAGGKGGVLERGDLRVRVTAPLDGEVVATGDFTDGCLYQVKPAGDPPRLDHLLSGVEAQMWMTRELEALQRRLTPRGAAPVLADGGVPMGDLMTAYPDADWDGICGDLCLDA